MLSSGTSHVRHDQMYEPRNWCKKGRKLLDTSGVFGLPEWFFWMVNRDSPDGFVEIPMNRGFIMFSHSESPHIWMGHH